MESIFEKRSRVPNRSSSRRLLSLLVSALPLTVSSTTMVVHEASAAAGAAGAAGGGFCRAPLSPSTMSCEGSFVVTAAFASMSSTTEGGTAPSPPPALGAVGALFQSCLSVGAAIARGWNRKKAQAPQRAKRKEEKQREPSVRELSFALSLSLSCSLVFSLAPLYKL